MLSLLLQFLCLAWESLVICSSIILKIFVSFNALSQPGGVLSVDFPSHCQSHLLAGVSSAGKFSFSVRSVFLHSLFLFCLCLPWSASLLLLPFCSDAHLMDEINRGLMCIVNSPHKPINYVRFCVPHGSPSLMRDHFRKPLDSLTLLFLERPACIYIPFTRKPKYEARKVSLHECILLICRGCI